MNAPFDTHWRREIVTVLQREREHIVAINDATSLARRLGRYEHLYRLQFYTRYLHLVSREPQRGVQDALLAIGSRVFQAKMTSLRRDLAAVAEVNLLNSMLER